MNKKITKIEIEGKKKTFKHKGREFRTNIVDVRDFIESYLFVNYNITIKDLNTLSKCMSIYLHDDDLKQKIKIFVTFAEIESKAEFNPLFERVNSYKSNINDFGFKAVKTAMYELEKKIND